MKRIVCAANRSLNKVNDVHYLVLGVRHFDDIMRKQIIERFGEEFCKNYHWEQGFIDNKGKFLTRKQAFVIAQNADQIITKNIDTYGTLYSEDLY